MLKRLIATMILIGLLASTQAYAAPICEYFNDIGYVYISGSAGRDYANKTVNFMLKENGNDSPEDDSILYIGDFRTDASGNYVYKFKISLSGNPEDYFIHSRIYGQSDEQTPLIQGEWLTAAAPVFDRNTNEILISGSYKYESDEKDLRIKIKSGQLSQISDWDSDILYQSSVMVNDDNGLFNIAVDLTANNLTPGFYSFKLYDDVSGCEFTSQFEVYDIASVLNNINLYIENRDSSGLLTYINGKTDILGIDTWEITSGVEVTDLTADVYTLLINNDDNIANIEELQLEIKRAYFTDCLNRVVAQDYNTAKNILFPASVSDEENEDDVFKIKSFTYYTQYKDLEAKSKDSEILDKLIEKEGGLTSYSDVHKTLSDATLTLAMNETEFWNQIQNIVNTNDDYFTLEDIPAQVWKDVWDLRPFSDIADFELKCKDLNAILPTPTPTPTPAPVVGGGGGSPVVGRPAAPTDEKAPENFDKTENNTEPVVNVTFTDVPKNHWANTAIEYLYQKGIINGVGENRFNPDATLKREELIKMLVVATGNTPTGSESSFSDVDPNQWYAGYIATAKALGITNGKDNGSFGVGESLTREDAAVLCYRALGNKTSATANDLSFTDYEMISDYAKEAVANMVELGIINGKGDGTFAPKDYCTRAEISKILYGVLESISK